MKSIKYIGRYDVEEHVNENRNIFPSAKTKMDYIIKSLNSIGKSVHVISPAWTNGIGFYPRRSHIINACTQLIVGPTIGFGCNRILRTITKLYSLLWLTYYLLTKTEHGEEILVYHSISSMYPVRILKLFKNVSICLEVEEVYSQVGKYNRFRTREEMQFLKNADKYIFANKMLNADINSDYKPSCVLYGMYMSQIDYSGGFSDSKTHVVYAGIINAQKGSMTAVEIAKFLGDEYHIHIIGYGNEEEIRLLEERIGSVRRNTACEISFDGLLRGEAYLRFLQSCDIGLCPQTDESVYNNASFPSKISSYLSNGLRVVSVMTDAIKESPFSELLYMYKGTDPAEIAELIQTIDLSSSYDSRKKMDELNQEFVLCLASILVA